MFKNFLLSLPLSLLVAPTILADEARDLRIQNAITAMQEATLSGPQIIKLADEAQLALGEDYYFIPKKPANEYMATIGNSEDSELLGLVLGKKNPLDWLLLVSYRPEGYIREDDAKTWNIDDLLKSYREGTENGNIERKKNGFPNLYIVDWIAKPEYDHVSHKMSWGFEGSSEGTPENHLNYFTYAFGRHGYIVLTLVGDLAKFETDKVDTANILASIQFNEGKRYEDFNSSTDKVAEYGLAAIIAGVAAKKLGLIAVIVAFLAKAGKIILLGAAGVFAVVRGWFRRRKSAQEQLNMSQRDKTND